MKIGIATPVVTNVGGAALGWERDATIEDIGRVAETADRLGYHHSDVQRAHRHACPPRLGGAVRAIGIRWPPWVTSRLAPIGSGSPP